MTTPRGVRNHNPGNIDFNSRNDWQGQIGLELVAPGVSKPRFARFTSALYGIRALAILLRNYRGKDGMPGVGGPGIDTPLEIVNRWAPGSDNNNVAAYAAAIAKRLGVKPTDVIYIHDRKTLRIVVVSIITHENGIQPYADSLIDEAIKLALP